MINLTEEDKKKIKYEMNVWLRNVQLSTGSYYAKYCSMFCSADTMYGELIGKKVADIVGLKCPNYYIYWDEQCILSEDLNSYKGFYFAKDIGINNTILNDIRECLEKQRDECGRFTNVDELMFQVYMMHFIDILFSNTDRHEENYGFILKDDGKGELVIFDHGDILTHLDIATRPLSFDKASDMDYALYSKAAEASYFFENASEEVMTMVNSLFLAFDVRRVSMILNSVEKDANRKFVHKKEYLKAYKKNYKMIKKLLLEKERKNKRGR